MSAEEQSEESKHQQQKHWHVSDSFHPSPCQSTRYAPTEYWRTTTYVEQSKQTVAEYLERWLTTVKPSLGDKTFERYKQLVEVNINPRLGPIQMCKLQPVQLAEFYTWSTTAGN